MFTNLNTHERAEFGTLRKPLSVRLPPSSASRVSFLNAFRCANPRSVNSVPSSRAASGHRDWPAARRSASHAFGSAVSTYRVVIAGSFAMPLMPSFVTPVFSSVNCSSAGWPASATIPALVTRGSRVRCMPVSFWNPREHLQRFVAELLAFADVNLHGPDSPPTFAAKTASVSSGLVPQVDGGDAELLPEGLPPARRGGYRCSLRIPLAGGVLRHDANGSAVRQHPHLEARGARRLGRRCARRSRWRASAILSAGAGPAASGLGPWDSARSGSGSNDGGSFFTFDLSNGGNDQHADQNENTEEQKRDTADQYLRCGTTRCGLSDSLLSDSGGFWFSFRSERAAALGGFDPDRPPDWVRGRHWWNSPARCACRSDQIWPCSLPVTSAALPAARGSNPRISALAFRRYASHAVFAPD